MTVREMHSIIKRIFPDVPLRYLVTLINEAISSEMPEKFSDVHYMFISTQSGQRFYGLPDSVQVIRNVYYKNSSDNYKLIKRLTGDIEDVDIT